jgi:hypothetical protein
VTTRTSNLAGLGWICLALGLITLAVFWPSLAHDFLSYDDQAYVTENPHVRAGLTWPGVVWAFESFSVTNWHPLTWLSHMLDCQLYGLKPAGHHLTNLLLHTASTLLLFLVLNRMTGALWRSACVAALFAWHPLHVESVAWVAERKDVLSAFFFMLTLWAYARYAEGRRQDSGASTTHHVSRFTHHVSRFTLHVSRFTLLPPQPLLLRPGPDEQADAGDPALCAPVAGLLAPAAVPTLNSQPSTLNPLAAGGGEDSVSSLERGRLCADA